MEAITESSVGLRKDTCPDMVARYSAGITEGISIDPAVCRGKPVIEGTRVLVSTILGALAGGNSREVIAEDYEITVKQISAALQFASEIADLQVSAYEVVA